MTTGTRVGPYEILGKLGAGGMGEVYRASDTRLGREVAIKVLPASFANDPDRLRRFEQEARATGMLNHPNILAVYDVGTHDGVPYLVTELLEGQTLRDELPVPRRKALDYARQIAAGLAAAHAKGITHRDLKPDNLFITKEGRAKILDFGLAKVTVVETDSDATRTGATTPGMALGTVGYMSPEQARGKPADHRSDIFSFGVILYEMLSGQRAFQRDSAMDSLSAILKEDPPPLQDAALEPVVRRCLEKSPEQRFQSASDLGFAIEALSGAGVSGAHSGISSGMASGVGAAIPADGVGEDPSRGQALSGRAFTGPALTLAAVCALVALATGLAAGFWWQARRDAAIPVWRGERLTSSGIVYGVRVSPDGRTLAFVSLEGRQSQVAVMHPGSTNWTVLTHESGKGEIEYLTWSRDGAKIYFARRSGIYSVPALGGDERMIVEQATAPEVLADGSLLMTRISADRRTQLHHYWPDTGKDEALNAEIIPRIRVFADGKEALFIGRPYDDLKAVYNLVAFDLASQKFRALAPSETAFSEGALALSPDGKSVLAETQSGDQYQITEFARDGKSKARVLATMGSPIWFLDSGVDADGVPAIYTDQVSRPFDLLRFPLTGGTPERVVETQAGGAPIPLADGRIAFLISVANRNAVMVTQIGKSPVPLLETEEELAGPLAAVGPDLIALRIGKGGLKNREVALASLKDGRIVKRIAATRGIGINAMTASPDGKTIYCVSQGNVFSVAVDGGDPKKIGSADTIAAHPNGRDLILARTEEDGVHLYLLPVSGGAEERLPFHTDMTLNASISPSAVRADGKIAITVLPPNSWWDEAAIYDPATGNVQKINVPYSGDSFAPAWTIDGRMISTGQLIDGSVWRFKPVAAK